MCPLKQQWCDPRHGGRGGKNNGPGTGGQTPFKTIFAPAAFFADAPHFGPPHFHLEAQSQEFHPGYKLFNLYPPKKTVKV